MTYVMKPLSCDPNRIRGMSERMIISHYENNYGGAVKRLNLIDEKLAELDYANAPGFLVNGLKREQLIATNSMILHEVFFDGLGEESEPRLKLEAGAGTRLRLLRPLARRVHRDGQGARRGLRLGAANLVATGSKAHQSMGVRSLPHHGGGTPILALDMYEHSYHIDYGAKAANYVDVFMAAINWPAAQRAYERLLKLDQLEQDYWDKRSN
jgi:superoxide dismutase, Fe-Mn family